MRIAFVTPEPWAIGGMPGVATQVIRGLTALGHEVDCFVTGNPDAVARVDLVPRERLCVVDTGFRHGRWYSRRVLPAYGTELGLRSLASYRLARSLVIAHRRRPYDLVYRHSTIELHGLRPHLDELPPVVVQPGVHAAGELEWLVRESALADRCTPGWRNRLVRSGYAVRARMQARDARRVAGILCPSASFADAIVRDYGVDRRRVHVVPQPVDLEVFTPRAPADDRGPGKPVRALCAGRIAVRKGIDTLVAATHRMDDLRGRVHLQVVGHPSAFSDYRPLLADLDPRIASFDDRRQPGAMPDLFAAADVALVPSRFEPFGLTAVEALGSGTPVVGTTAVGALEVTESPACRRVPPGDVEALAQAVREVVEAFERGDGPALRSAARREAERCFAPSVVVPEIAGVLERVASTGGP